MIGKVLEVNYSRGLIGYETKNGYGYFEILNGLDDIETDDEISGNLEDLENHTVLNMRNRSKYSVFIEDFGMDYSTMIEIIS